VVFPLCLTSIYLIDVGWTLVKRLRKRESLLQAHRSHTYQQLVDHGLSHQTVSLLVAGLTTVSGVIGLVASEGTSEGRLSAIALAFTLGIFYVLSPRFVHPTKSAS
jgi:hypothetical protein